MKSFITYLNEADYRRFLKNNKNLSRTQQKEINTYFSVTNQQAGSKIGKELGWQSREVKNMTYDDFLNIMIEYKSGRKSVLKAPKMKGKKNEDYIKLNIKSKDFLAYVPLNYLTAKFMNTKKFGVCSGEWCIGSTLSDYHWQDECILQKQVPVYVINTEGKWVAMIQPGNKSLHLWDEANHPDYINDEIEGIDIRKELLTSSLKKLYDEIRKIIKENALYPTWLKHAKFKDEVIEIDDSGTITWEKGVWITGDARFYSWKTGLWKGGTWNGGTWTNGLWEGGIWNSGFWNDGVWKGGLFEGGIWEDGIWEDGIWNLGHWKGGTWKGGEWKKGVWEGGYDKDGNFHKYAPNMWGAEDYVKDWAKYYQLITKQQGMEGELFERLSKEMSILTSLAHNKKLIPDMNKMTIEVAGEKQIRIKGAVVHMGERPKLPKNISITFQESDIENIYLRKGHRLFFDVCKINYADVVYDQHGQIFRDCAIYGGVFDVTNLADYASHLSSYGITVSGGVFENKGKARKSLYCDSFRSCALMNLIPEGKMFSDLLFDNCYIDTDKMDNIKGCKFVGCEFADRKKFNKFRDNVIVG